MFHRSSVKPFSSEDFAVVVFVITKDHTMFERFFRRTPEFVYVWDDGLNLRGVASGIKVLKVGRWWERRDIRELDEMLDYLQAEVWVVTPVE
jgi:hypothetical protein